MPAPDTLRLLLPVLAAMGLLLTAGVAALIHLVTQSRGNSAAWNHRLARFAETSPWRRADALFLLALLALAQIIRRPFPVFPCPIADWRLSAFARRPAAWNVLHPTWRGREGVLWRMGKAGTVW